jgi:hypothetical protein
LTPGSHAARDEEVHVSRYQATLIALGLLVAPLGAQQTGQPVALRRGAEIRVYTGSHYRAGRLAELSPATIVVVRTDATVDTVPRSAVLAVQVREGRRWTEIRTEQLPSACAPLEGPVAANGMMVLPGARLRITSSGSRLQGTLVEWRGDTALLKLPDDSVHAVPIDAESRIAVSAGRHGGALAGLLVGFALGAAGGKAGADALCNGIGFGSGDCGGAALTGGAAGGLALGGVGAAIGSGFHSERWITVPPDSLRAYLAYLAPQKP